MAHFYGGKLAQFYSVANTIFNIKPFALMTQHPAEMSRLPKQLREMVPAEERSNRQLTRPSKEIVDMAFQMFWSAIAPLRDAGKLGMLAFQSRRSSFRSPPISTISRAFPNGCREPRSQSSSVTRVGFATKLDGSKP